MGEHSSEERRVSAFLRYFFHIDPDLLTEDEFWMRWGELKYVLQKTGQMKE